MADSTPHVLIVGAAYAGIKALNNLIALSSGKDQQGLADIPQALHRKPRYTILDERDGFYHTVGAPLGQLNSSYAREFWIQYADILKDKAVDEDIRFVQGTASDLDPASKILKYVSLEKTKASLCYDYLIVATGIRRGFPVVPEDLNEVPYLRSVEEYVKPLQNASKIVIVGGGAVGIEMAAEAKKNYPKSEVILLHSRDTLLSNEPLPGSYKAKAHEILLEQGVQVQFGTRVLSEQKSATGIQLSLSNDQTISCDHVIYTAKQRGANTSFLPRSFPDLLDSKDCVNVRPTLQFPTSFPNANDHYAVGDAASWPHIKRSGAAGTMGKIAAENIINTLIALEDGKAAEDAELVTCPSGGQPTMSLAIGDQAISMRGGVLRWGKEIKQRAFGRGLGIEGTLEGLGIKPKVAAKEISHPSSGTRAAAFVTANI